MHKFTLVNCDTDSIMVCKPNGEPFMPEEQDALLVQLNSLYPESIRWEDDGYFPSVVVLKAKNYIMRDEKGKIKSKGSALKASQKEPALKEFINRFTTLLLDHNQDRAVSLYHEYVAEIKNVQDMSRWVTKRTITKNVLEAKRLNEQKVLDAVAGMGVGQGDKVYLYYTPDGTMKEISKWEQDHDVSKLLLRLYDTALIFENVVNKDDFVNYSLVRNAIRLERLDDIVVGQAHGGKVHTIKTERGKFDFKMIYPGDPEWV